MKGMKCPRCGYHFVNYSEVIVEVLKIRGVLRFTKLLEATQMSKRALSLNLKKLVEKGIVKRGLDVECTEYPPPVYYQLSKDYLSTLPKEKE